MHRISKRISFNGVGGSASVFLTVLTAIIFIKSATSQHHSLLNTPPILYVPERNWRIFETEGVGQIISRIRAEDAENDELIFGLEPHFHANFANPNDDSNGKPTRDELPFRIDQINGVVYLNESLIGRGGENFFLYITVSDGQLTAKNEVFVNILGRNAKGGSRAPPSVSSVVQNISQFLPPFGSLPGVQSIRYQHPSIFKPNGNNAISNSNGYFPGKIFNPNQQQLPIWLSNNPENNDDPDNGLEPVEEQQTSTQISTLQKTTTATRIKLTPISGHTNRNNNASISEISERPKKTQTPLDEYDVESETNGIDPATASTPTNSTNSFTLRATVIPVVIVVCGLFVAAAVIFLFLYRKRLCAISKTLKKKSKEEMAKKSNQSNLSSNLTDDSRNSMVMQHWNGPMAYGNRYVPWDRDQQLLQHSMATSQLSTSAANDASLCGDPTAISAVGGVSNINGVVGGAGVGTNNCANNSQTKCDRWEFPRHRLKFFNILGEGAFGQVWRCEATDIDGVDGVSTVAVKTLKENAAEVEKKDLLSELEVMKSLEPHVNVVRFLGCCTDKDPVFVIIEYVNRGKLQTYLRNSRAERHYGNTHGKSNVLTSGDLTSFMYQVAKGMDYLTSRGIIHRDLAARNILIMDDHTCKVADFGFARDVVTSKIYERKSEGKLPIRWMATESLYDNIFSIKSDIWSFGILMWEIVTLGSTPYPGISAADVMRKVRDGYRLEKPEHCRRELYNIMYYCWSSDANERPTFSEVVQMLDKLLHTEMDYIELERFPDHNYYNIVNLSGEKL